MNSISLKDLKNDCVVSKPAFLDGGYIVLSPETPITAALVNSLISWEFRTLQSEGTVVEQAGAPEPEAEDKEGAQAVLASKSDDREKTQAVLTFYQDFTKFVDQTFTKYVTKNELSIKDISLKLKELCDVIRENKRFILRIQDPGQANRNYLVNHSVKSTILAIVLGSYLKLPPARLIELGTACLLHEIGMVRLPPQLYMNDRPLTPQEKKNITAHPVIGYNLLKELDFPLSISLAALEHHERMNGSGYPRQLTGERISLYSKIIAVACSYDAVTSSRPYKEAKDGYNGMLELLKNTGKQYDEQVIRALVYSLSVYPIGTFVILSNGKPGQVVDINPENPRFPIVMVLGQKTGKTDEEMQIRTKEDGIKIAKPITKEQAQALAGKVD